MAAPRIYADFNSIEYLDDQGTATVNLTGYGSLASLSNQKIRLTEGMALLLFEPNDIEVEGIAHFDSSLTDSVGRTGEWVAIIDHRQIRGCSAPWPQDEHLCLGCGRSLLAHLKAVGRRYDEVCPYCGTSVMAPLMPPDNIQRNKAE